jgi:hypothetical protein
MFLVYDIVFLYHMGCFSFQIFPTPSSKVIPDITVVVFVTIVLHWLTAVTVQVCLSFAIISAVNVTRLCHSSLWVEIILWRGSAGLASLGEGSGVRRSSTFDEQWLGTASSVVAFCSGFWCSENSCCAALS